MQLKFANYLASPLKIAVNFFEKNQISYKLKEIKPPYKNKDNLKSNGLKRVLNIKKEDSFYLIIWSFQYNS